MKFNFFAPIEGTRGYPILARNLAKALDSLGVDVRLFTNDGDPPTSDERILKMYANRVNADIDGISVNLCVAHPALMGFFGGRVRIGYTLNETTDISERAAKTLCALDGVWTASTFTARMLKRRTGKDIGIVPGGVDTDIFKRVENANIKEVDGAFTFLAVGKWEPRKGYDILLRAFQREFHNERAVLVLACHNPHLQGFDAFERLWAERIQNRERPKILIAKTNMTDAELAALYSCANAFVLPTRGEGFCLPALEAMSCGTPVIATNWSSIPDFLHDGIGYPVRVLGLVPASDPNWQQFLVGEWAEPDEVHLREQMRYAFDNPDETRKKGQAAATEVREKWTWKHAAQKAIKELEKW